MIIFDLNITMITLIQMLSSMYPFYETDLTGKVYKSIMNNETIVRNMFEISCKPECNMDIYQSLEEIPNHCFICDLDPEEFPDMDFLNYKMIGIYDVAMCDIYNAYELLNNENKYISNKDFNELVLIATTRMKSNMYQLDFQLNKFVHQENPDEYVNNAYGKLIKNIASNTILNSKISEIVEYVCDKFCIPYSEQYEIVEGYYKNIYETPNLCRINDVELEEGRKYTFHYEYSIGMCELFKILRPENQTSETEKVSITHSQDTDSGIEKYEIVLIIAGSILALVIIIAITICCIKRIEWNRMKREIEENVSA